MKTSVSSDYVALSNERVVVCIREAPKTNPRFKRPRLIVEPDEGLIDR